VKTSVPAAQGLFGYGWTLKKLQQWVIRRFDLQVSRSHLRHLLKANRLSWKKCRKLLKKADPRKRQAYIQRWAALYAQMQQGKVRLVYVDEAHVHRDLELGYTWAPVGQVAWRASDSPSLSERINWYGAYDFSCGQCFVWHEGACNGEHTIQFLTRLRTWLGDSPEQVVIVWDGASWHRAKQVQRAAAELGFEVVPLPGYSPDLNPIEGLWKWLRAEVTQQHCYVTLRELFLACLAFIERINQDPLALITRLWPKFELDPAYEKLLLS
jgi:transposase